MAQIMAAEPGLGRSAWLHAPEADCGGKMAATTQRAVGLIVVGVNGAEASLAAVRWAVQEACWYQARVHLVFAALRYPRASYAGAPEEPPWVDGDADGTALLAAAQREAARALAADRVSSELAAGSPAKVLIDWSARAELLVLGSAYPAGGAASRTSPAMGSVARACLNSAACPVAVVTSPMEPPASVIPGPWAWR
jgi:nucleotide-binding universal stress UspA family protein